MLRITFHLQNCCVQFVVIILLQFSILLVGLLWSNQVVTKKWFAAKRFKVLLIDYWWIKLAPWYSVILFKYSWNLLFSIPFFFIVQSLNFRLLFNDLHLWSVILSVIIMNYTFVDGKSDYFQGKFLLPYTAPC